MALNSLAQRVVTAGTLVAVLLPAFLLLPKAFGLVLIGLQRLGFILPPDAGALHALAAGGIGTVTLVMLLRVARQRAGELPASPALLQALQIALAVAVTLRVAGGWILPGQRESMLWLAALAWLVAFGLGTAVLLPAAWRPPR